MTVIDPFLDRSQNSAPARLESREMAMLRHDIRGALMGVTGAAGYLETAEIDAGLRPQVERIAAASRVLACLIEAALGEEPDPDEPRIEPRIEISALSRICGGAILRRPPTAGSASSPRRARGHRSRCWSIRRRSAGSSTTSSATRSSSASRAPSG